MTDDTMPAFRQGGPELPDAAARTTRQRDLGLANIPDARFDAFARKIVESTGALAAMVNLIGDRRQYFAGLHVNGAAAPGDPALLGDPGREMDVEHGFCPHVVARRKALVLDDVYAYPRFAGNPIVDELGVRSYLGAPIIDEDGTVLGTVCAVDPSPRGGAEDPGWGRRGLEVIKGVAGEVMAEIRARQRLAAATAAAPGTVLITTLAHVEVLHANAAHERLFGPLPELGAPAAAAFPELGAAGVLAALDTLRSSGEPAVTPPVRLAEDSRSVLFAAVPASVPGHRTAALVLGMADTTAQHCAATALELAADIANTHG